MPIYEYYSNSERAAHHPNEYPALPAPARRTRRRAALRDISLHEKRAAHRRSFARRRFSPLTSLFVEFPVCVHDDQIHYVIDLDIAAVYGKIVVHWFAPFPACVVGIIVGSRLVSVLHEFLYFLFRNAVLLDRALYLVGLLGIHENIRRFRHTSQHIVRASPDDDA